MKRISVVGILVLVGVLGLAATAGASQRPIVVESQPVIWEP